MITSFLRESFRKEKEHKADVKFIDNSVRIFSRNISFSRCFGHGGLLVTVGIKDFEFVQRRFLPLDW